MRPGDGLHACGMRGHYLEVKFQRSPSRGKNHPEFQSQGAWISRPTIAPRADRFLSKHPGSGPAPGGSSATAHHARRCPREDSPLLELDAIYGPELVKTMPELPPGWRKAFQISLVCFSRRQSTAGKALHCQNRAAALCRKAMHGKLANWNHERLMQRT